MSNEQTGTSYGLSSDVSVHLAFPESHVPMLKQEDRSRGFEVHSISFANCTTVDDFFARISDEFEFPMKAVSTPSLIGWLGNLEWRDSTDFVFVIDDIQQLADSLPNAFGVMMYVLPYALDRQRSGESPFHVFVTGMSDDLVDRALYDLNDANNSLEADDSTINPSYPVRIVIHVNNEP